MKASRSILLLFFWPVLLVVLVAIGIGYWSLYSLKYQYEEKHLSQLADLAVVQQAADFSREVGGIHQRVAGAIDAARTGELSEVQLYFLHADIVNDFEVLTNKVSQLANSELLREVNHGSVLALQEEYQSYRRFIIMATDIIAIDPQEADSYVRRAQDNFIQFSIYTQRITKLLAERSEVRSKEGFETQEQFFYSVILIGMVGLLLMFLVALFSAGLVSRKMLYIADALSALASSDQQILIKMPQIERMHERSNGEFGRIAGALLSFRDAIERRKKAEAEAFQLSFYDPLTELPNRRLLLERLRHSLAVTERNSQYGALLYFDLDHFKTINDVQGHKAGDMLLLEVAKRLGEALREGDSLARVGGDEFVVTLESLGHQSRLAANKAEEVAELIRHQLNRPYEIEGTRQFSTPSIGVVIFRGVKETTDDLLKHAETAMYSAKNQGRNRISFYDAEMQKEVERRAQLESELRDAIEQQQLELFYQIQVDEHNHPNGAEALIRWHHPTRGQVSPADFIPLAEETGQIVPMGRWILHTACEQLKAWQGRPGFDHITIAVNVSAKQFKEASFVDEVNQAMKRAGVNPGHLKIELTESTILDNVEEAILKMRHLRSLGVKFSLDDFGTGYSSLQYLKRLPLDQIKIDQTFVRDLATDADDEVIVQTIIAMSKALALEVIAEGVETQEQKDILLRQGCEHFQGYFFGKPCPIQDFNAHIGQ